MSLESEILSSMNAFALSWLRGCIDQSAVDIEQSQPDFHPVWHL